VEMEVMAESEWLSKPIWVTSRYSILYEQVIPAHLIETKEALENEKSVLRMELDYLHPKRKDGDWDMRYTRNKGRVDWKWPCENVKRESKKSLQELGRDWIK